MKISPEKLLRLSFCTILILIALVLYLITQQQKMYKEVTADIRYTQDAIDDTNQRINSFNERLTETKEELQSTIEYEAQELRIDLP